MVSRPADACEDRRSASAARSASPTRRSRWIGWPPGLTPISLDVVLLDIKWIDPTDGPRGAMRVSLSITNFSWSGRLAGRLTDVARRADDGGLDTLWVADHLLQADPNSSPEAEMLEAYTTLGFLAAQTRRIRLGTL